LALETYVGWVWLIFIIRVKVLKTLDMLVYNSKLVF